MVFDDEIVNYQDKGDGARGVAEETGCVGLVEVKALEEGDKTKIGQLTCLFEAVHSLPSRCGRLCTAFRICPA